jgi:hypothetical protein
MGICVHGKWFSDELNNCILTEVGLPPKKYTSVFVCLPKPKRGYKRILQGQVKSMYLYFGERRKIGGENHTGAVSFFQFGACII